MAPPTHRAHAEAQLAPHDSLVDSFWDTARRSVKDAVDQHDTVQGEKSGRIVRCTPGNSDELGDVARIRSPVMHGSTTRLRRCTDTVGLVGRRDRRRDRRRPPSS